MVDGVALVHSFSMRDCLQAGRQAEVVVVFPAGARVWHLVRALISEGSTIISALFNPLSTTKKP